MLQKELQLDLYIIGIGGTFMGHLALLAKQLGLSVSGCDANIYSPMKEMLIKNQITFDEGYDQRHLSPAHKLYVIGNGVSRGNPMIEAILNQQRPMTSGPEWLYQHVLKDKWVIAVAGTHGKTTTTSMIVWMLTQLNFAPGYLIGGAAKGLDSAAALGDSKYFVIEADEYDTAFFDKRSKFIHYHPKTLVLHNLEFDHADIFDDLKAIVKTMHHLVRTVPGQGRIITPVGNVNLQHVLEMGCWSEHQAVNLESITQEGLSLKALNADASHVLVSLDGELAELRWSIIGQHNLANAGSALGAVLHLGVSLADAVAALAVFPGVARRMDLRLATDTLTIYDDFAHHPTAIQTSLAALRAKVGAERIVALLEPRSNTMRMGVHANALGAALIDADEVYWLLDDRVHGIDIEDFQREGQVHFAFKTAAQLFEFALDRLDPTTKSNWLCMSNGAFGGLFYLMAVEFNERFQ